MLPSIYSRALRKAAELVGGSKELARRLRVPMSELAAWMNDKSAPPRWVFLKAVDIILEETPAPGESEPGDPSAPRESAPAGDRSETRY